MRLDTVEDVEQLRRSIVMLSPQQWALRREEAIQVLERLEELMRDT